MGRGWRRVRGTSPNEQSWETGPYGTEVVQADDADSADKDQLRHAKDQLIIGQQYPGSSLSLPGARVIKIDAGKRSTKI